MIYSLTGLTIGAVPCPVVNPFTWKPCIGDAEIMELAQVKQAITVIIGSRIDEGWTSDTGESRIITSLLRQSSIGICQDYCNIMR